MKRRWYESDALLLDAILLLEGTRPVHRFQTVNYIHHLLLENYPEVFDKGQELLEKKFWGYLGRRQNLTVDAWTDIDLLQYLEPEKREIVALEIISYILSLEKKETGLYMVMQEHTHWITTSTEQRAGELYI